MAAMQPNGSDSEDDDISDENLPADELADKQKKVFLTEDDVL